MSKKPKKPTAPESVPVEIPEAVTSAIQEGRSLIEQGKTKADAAMAMYRLIGDLGQQMVVDAFITAAGLTPKGALTYWYNCKRKVAKENKISE